MPSIRHARTGGGRTNRNPDSQPPSRPESQASRSYSSLSELPKIESRTPKSPPPNADGGAQESRPKTSWKGRRPATDSLDQPRATTSCEAREPDRSELDSSHLQLARMDAPKKQRSELPKTSGRDSDQRTGTASSTSSWTSSVFESKVVDFQKSFLNKNAPKFGKLFEVFRDTDLDKRGRIDRAGLLAATRRLDIALDPRVADALMARCADPAAGMTLNEFRDQLWVDDRVAPAIGAGGASGGARAGSAKGDQAGAKYLWTAVRPAASSAGGAGGAGGRGAVVGTLNDTLEAERREAGALPPRLDFNFSSVRYNLVSFDSAAAAAPPPDPRLPVPVRRRPSLFSPPPAAGRCVAFDHGDAPYNVVTLRTPRPEHLPPPPFQVPVRLVTFARVSRGEYPTQRGHFLSKTFV